MARSLPIHFIEDRLVEHLSKDLSDPDVWRRTTALVDLLIEPMRERREHLGEVLSPLSHRLDATRVKMVDRHEVGSLLSEMFPAHSFALSLSGRLVLWTELFARREDIEAEVHIQRQPWYGIDSTCDHADFDAMTQGIAHVRLSWKFTRAALCQAHLVPAEISERIARHHAHHGGFELGPWESPRWQEQQYPNAWKTVDYHARDVLKFGKHNPSSYEDLYLIAWKDVPRQRAYVGAASSVDGGSFGGIPACMTQTRYRDLETCLTLGARHGFCDGWTLHDPDDQDFGAFTEVERELHVDSWFDTEDDSIYLGPVEEALLHRSASKMSGEQVLRARLREAGASEFVTAQMWDWLHEDVALLLCK